jgi:hypothetical protein
MNQLLGGYGLLQSMQIMLHTGVFMFYYNLTHLFLLVFLAAACVIYMEM